MSAKTKLRKIGETMRIYREASGRAIAVAANALGVEVDYLRMAESGKVELTFTQYLSLAELYGIGFSALFENGNGYFKAPDVPQKACNFICERFKKYCIEKHRSQNEVRNTLGMSSSIFHYFFCGYSKSLSPRVIENIVALFNITSNELRNVCMENDKDTVEKQVDPPVEKPIDALTMVTDALAFYKKRNDIVAELEKIIKTAQALLEEMKA